MRLLFGEDAAVAAWVAAHIPRMVGGPGFGPCAAIGVVDGAGLIVGGVVYHNYMPTYGNIELSFAATSRRWLTKPIICALLRYPFEQLGCIRITGVTPRKATSARRFLDKFGFKREGLVRKGFGTDDAVISGLLRTEWDPANWRPRHFEAPVRTDGQKHSAGAAPT